MLAIDLTEDKGRKPRLKAPPKSCDTHSHIYGPRDLYPHVEGRESRYAPVEVYRAMLERIGIERSVIVQPSLYGYDNRCTLAAIAALGQDRARGTAVIAPSATKEEIQRLHDGGIRGIRISHSGDELSPETARDIARLIAPLGWILQIQDSRKRWIEDAVPLLSNLPVPLIFDHLGRTPPEAGASDPEFKALLKLVETDNIWVKISGVYYSSRSPHPGYADAVERIQTLVKARPDRILWALNWPLPGFPGPDEPDSADFLDPLLDWVPDEATRAMILAGNPGKLYGFDD
ncbi:MAG: amidohydrolase family protein [Rhodospirillales bacterium]